MDVRDFIWIRNSNLLRSEAQPLKSRSESNRSLIMAKIVINWVSDPDPFLWIQISWDPLNRICVGNPYYGSGFSLEFRNSVRRVAEGPKGEDITINKYKYKNSIFF